MNDWFVDLMDHFSVLLVNDGLMNFPNLFLMNNRLVVLMDYRLVMLMQHLLMMFNDHRLMMFMDDIFVMLFDNRLTHMSLDQGCLLMLLGQSAFDFLLYNSSFLVFDHLRLRHGHLNSGLVKFDFLKSHCFVLTAHIGHCAQVRNLLQMGLAEVLSGAGIAHKDFFGEGYRTMYCADNWSSLSLCGAYHLKLLLAILTHFYLTLRKHHLPLYCWCCLYVLRYVL